MEFENLTFNMFTNTILRYIDFDVMEELIDNYKIDVKDKKKLKNLVKVIQKFKMKDMEKRKLPKDLRIAFLLLYIVARFYINNEKMMIEMDLKKIEAAEEFVKENKIQESDYLSFCNNFTTQNKIINFFRDKCFCCLDFERNDEGNLVISPRLNVEMIYI